MPRVADIPIHTIYSADEVVRPGRWQRAVGLATVLVAASWLYVTWQPMYRWVHRALAAGEIDAYVSAGGAEVLSQQQAAELRSATTVRVGAAYGWLAMMTSVGLWLLTGGVAESTCSPAARCLGKRLFPLAVLILGALVWYVWKEYQWYETALPSWVRPTVVGLLALSAISLGVALNRRGIGLLRAGAVLVIVSAVLSVAVVWSAIRWGRMSGEQVTFVLYAKIFAAQSVCGWLLLLATMGARKRTCYR